MAGNRLTWKNVAAPDYSNSMQGHALASSMFQDALGGLSDSLGSFITERKQEEKDALLKQQEAAEGAFLRQMASASGDADIQAALRRGLGSNTQVSNEFIGKQLTDFRNSLLTGDTSAENLRQTTFENKVKQRDQLARDVVAPLQAEILRREQLGDKEGVARLQQEYFEAIAGMSQEDQRALFQASMGQRKDADGLVTSDLSRKQTRQQMYQSGVNFNNTQTDRKNAEAVQSLILFGRANSVDPVAQRGAIISAGAKGNLPASVVNKALAEVGQQPVGSTGGTGGTGGTSTTSSSQQGNSITPGSKALLDEADLVSAQLASRLAAEQQPIGARALDALEDNEALLAQYERQKKAYPTAFNDISLDDYTKIFRELSQKHTGLSRGAIAEMLVDNFTRGESTWDRIPTWILPAVIPREVGRIIAPDLGRTAGVDMEGANRAAQVLNTVSGRNNARNVQEKLNNASTDLKDMTDALTQAQARVEAAWQHYQQFGNPNVVTEAEEEQRLAELNLSDLVKSFKADEGLSELFADPEDPARTITPQESRKRQNEAERVAAETTQNRAFASANIPRVREQLRKLDGEYMVTPPDSPRRLEISREYLKLSEELKRLERLAR